MCLKTSLFAFVVILLCGGVPAAQELPPDILVDQRVLEATEAMETGDLQTARRAFEKIEALNIEPTRLFAYSYGKFLVEHGGGVEDWRKGQSLLRQLVISVGRESEYYTPTLKLLSVVEAKILSVVEAKILVDAQMVRVPGGRFTMGCTREQRDCNDIERPAHQVEVSSFEIGKYEVTQKVWAAVMGANPSDFQGCAQCPVEQVSWDDIQAFLRKLNAEGGRYRLPSEAEWEYAARGGRQSRGYEHAGSNNPNAVAWYEDNSGEKTHRVGQQQANELGLHDMSGNVWEWVQDCWNANYAGAPSNGRAWTRGDCSSRVLRGGSWYSIPRDLRSANRFRFSSGFRSSFFGFRIARSLD